MRLVSGIQPSGNITLGNYLGAIKNFLKCQEDTSIDDILVFIADLHAITVPQDKTALRQNIKSLAALYNNRHPLSKIKNPTFYLYSPYI